MKRLKKKEEEIMDFFWDHGDLFVRELRDLCPEPRPHINTLSTQVRLLELEGYLHHREYGATYQYYAAISREDYRKEKLDNVVSRYFGKSYLRVISSLVKDEKVSVDELKRLIESTESNGR